MLINPRPFVLATLALAALGVTGIEAKDEILPFALPATFQGVWQCWRCAGTQVTITLYSDGWYWRRVKEIGRDTPDRGGVVELWSYDRDTGVLSLTPEPVGPPPPTSGFTDQYLVGFKPPSLQHLDSSGNASPDPQLALLNLPPWASSLQIVWWRLVELSGKKMPNSSMPTGAEMGVRLDVADNSIWGIGGCNEITGAFHATSSEMLFERLSPNGGYCEKKMVGTESAFLAALANVRSYKHQGDELDLFNGARAPVARFRAGALVATPAPY